MNNRTALFLASSVSLFLELLLIRWVSTEIPMLSYFKNFPLLAVFVGLGVGCLLAGNRRSHWIPSLWVLGALTIFICFTDVFKLDKMTFPEPNMGLWENLFTAASTRHIFYIIVRNLSVIFLILGGCAFSFVGLGQVIGRLLKSDAPLRMYTIDIVGSLTGVLGFALLCFMQTAPWVWLLVAIVPLLLVSRHTGAKVSRQALPVALLFAAVLISFWRTNHTDSIIRWSPYYRIEVRTNPANQYDVGQSYDLFVNRYIHQVMWDVPRLANPVAQGKRDFGTSVRLLDDHYNFPYYIKPHPNRVLIAGAGTGNDVSAALNRGVAHVTAVEIDPGIITLGKTMHPNRPYQDRRVELVNNDIRSYLRRVDTKYDLIVYGILDSHTALSSLSSIRLDNYVYTVEGMRDAINHLNPGGILYISFFENENTWLGQRIFNVIKQAGGQAPVSMNLTQVSCFIVGPGMDRAQIERRIQQQGYPVMNKFYDANIKPATDDWPFLYTNPVKRPWVYYTSLALIIIFATALVTWALKRGTRGVTLRMDWHMFYLGIGFLLVETKALAELSLLFGSTWIVNTFVFAGIFIMVLLANFAVRHGAGRRVGWAYLLLFASLAAWYFFPRTLLNELSFTARALVGTGLVVLPLFFAGLIFAKSFATRHDANVAFGANLLGAVIGGALEATSLAWGIRALTLLAIGFYLLSLATHGGIMARPSSQAQPDPDPARDTTEPVPIA